MAQELARTPTSEIETTRSTHPIAPPVDIYENEQELLLVADIPGVDASGLTVQLDPPELRIEGRRANGGTSGKDPSYARAFQVSEAVDPDGISAELSNGVLKVHLKKSQALRSRKIEVHAN